MQVISLLVLAGILGIPAAAGKIETLAGTGKAGYTGDNGPARTAQFNQPFQCDFDAQGNLYIVEAFNHCVRKIDLKTGIITTVAGTGQKGYSGDGGAATKATLNDPHSLIIDQDGNIFIADRQNAAIRRVDGKTGRITTVAGTGKKGNTGDGGPATAAGLLEPDDCCLDGKGGLLIADVSDWKIRRVDLKTGTITTFAGTGKPSGKVDRSRIGDGGPATKAIIVGARAVCADGKGNVYICEREGNAVRKVDSQGLITTFAGTGARGYGGDGGPARTATFNGPKAVRCDAQGNVFLADTENHAIRRIDVQTGIVTTVAGGHKGADGEGGDAARAGLDRPHGCIVARDGTLYIADSHNHRVLRVSSTH
jgi:streptogramin lyase